MNINGRLTKLEKQRGGHDAIIVRIVNSRTGEVIHGPPLEPVENPANKTIQVMASDQAITPQLPAAAYNALI